MIKAACYKYSAWGKSYMFLDNTLYGSDTICPVVGDHRGCPYFSLLQRTALRLMDYFQKRGFQLNMRKNGLASGAF